jgi:hypothetical protein
MRGNGASWHFRVGRSGACILREIGYYIKTVRARCASRSFSCAVLFLPHQGKSESLERGFPCRFMNSCVRSAAIPLNNSFLHPIRRPVTCARPAGILTRASSCPLFHVPRPPLAEGQANQPAPRPQEGFLEVKKARRFAVRSRTHPQPEASATRVHRKAAKVTKGCFWKLSESLAS